MYLNYYPILFIQAILSLIFVLIRRRDLDYKGYFRLIVINLSLGLIGLYIIPIRITRIHLFAVSPNLVPFKDMDLSVIDVSYLIMPFILITVLFCLLFDNKRSFKSILLASGLSFFIQFVAYAVQSQRAELTFIIIQLFGALLGYLFYLLIYKRMRCEEIKTTLG